MRTQKRMCGITKTRIGEIREETNRGHYTNIRVVIHGCRYWKDLSSRLHAMVLSQLVVNKSFVEREFRGQTDSVSTKLSG